MLENQPLSRSSLISHVLRVVTRGYFALERAAGAGYSAQHRRLTSTRGSALVSLELLGGEIGRLVYQRGCLVYVSLGEASPEVALRRLRAGIASSFYTLIELPRDQLALCLAAIDGEASAPPPERPALNTLLEHATATRFSGVLALELGAKLEIWQWFEGALLSSPTDPRDSTRAKLLRIAWTERDLPAYPSDALDELPGTGVRALAAPPRAEPAPPRPSTSARSLSATTEPSAAASDHASTERVWQVFAQLLREDIGLRSERLVLLLRGRYAQQSPSELRRSLRAQLERVSGSELAASFEALLSVP